jgi:hypothetical protein
MNVKGNLGGAISAFVFRNNEAPHYRSAHLILVGTTTMSFCLCGFMTWYLRRENARRDREYKAPDEFTRDEKLLDKDMGDYAKFFRYTI